MKVNRLLVLVLCSVMLSFTCLGQDDPALELPLDLSYETSSDELDFPRDEELRIVEPPPLPKEKDHPILRRTGHSLIPWGELKETEFLSVKRWIAERAERDKDPLWKVKLRLNTTREQVGKVISCIGTCILHRGTVPNKLRWLSRVLEGDEITTEKDSYLWLMLTDGTLVRLSPETSVGFLEMNVSKKRFFFHARLNNGYIYWKPRTNNELVETQLTETDRLFLPVMDPEANLEWFARTKLNAKTDSEKNLLNTTIEYQGKKEQYAFINNLIKKNNEFATVKHEALIVAPNVNATVQQGAFSLFYSPKGKSYAKVWRRDSAEVQTVSDIVAEATSKVSLFYRGYENTESYYLPMDTWIEISQDGRNMKRMEEVPYLLSASELLYKRIPTIKLVREKWLQQTKGVWESLQDSGKLASDWGLRLWGDELDTRLDFLTEHTRRVETTNLRALSRVTRQTSSDFDERYISRAMSKYLQDIKQRYSFSNTSVVDMIPLHYYGWVLINAKQQ